MLFYDLWHLTISLSGGNHYIAVWKTFFFLTLSDKLKENQKESTLD